MDNLDPNYKINPSVRVNLVELLTEEYVFEVVTVIVGHGSSLKLLIQLMLGSERI